MSNAPVNTGRVIQAIRKKTTLFSNEELLKLAGGTDKQWSDYLQGPKAQSVVYAVNNIIAEDNLELVSRGVGSKLWAVMGVAEAHMQKAYKNLQHVDQQFNLAHQHVISICLDVRAPKRLRDDATAYRKLMEEPQPKHALLILEEWALEITDDIGAKYISEEGDEPEGTTV